jgi:6-phosphogluconate dehydrogenase
MLLREAGASYDWKLNFGGIALMWRGGCIIRSAFLGKIKEAFDKGKFSSVINFRQRVALMF